MLVTVSVMFEVRGAACSLRGLDEVHDGSG